MVTLVLVCFQPTQQCQHHQHHPVCVVVFTTRCHTLHMRCTTPLNHLVSVSQTKPFDALAPIPFAINPHQPLCFTASHLATSTHTTVFAPSLCFLPNPKSNHSPLCNHHNPLTIMMSHKVSNKHHTLFLVLALFFQTLSLSLFSLPLHNMVVVVVHGDVHPQFVCVHSTTPITPKSNTMVPLLCNPPQPKRKK